MPESIATGGRRWTWRTAAASLSLTPSSTTRDDQKRLFELNRQLITSLGLVRGAAHAEFIKSAADGQFYFLEIAARVGGAYIAEVLEAASGINIWREWAGIELARGERPLELHTTRREYGGIALSLARQE